ncbi:hypothetical protein [Vibrio agarivorans]|uniref:hypothetical protein n=1 Tax=Vibrio agarivorans TaxID=153622 RepID=UPI0025B4F3C6|nr:hypothetical protein [Vibrio agarivorans]MDN3661167.1 hypothetical protein [Vibrio agarivorans]
MKKWLNPDYIQTLRTLAQMYARSKDVREEFYGDEATIFSLLMKADAWNVTPDYVLQGSFYDQYGVIAHTGKLLRLVLENNNEISSIKVTEIGSWEKIAKQYSVVSMDGGKPVYQESWDKAIAAELGLAVSIEFYDTTLEPIEYKLMLTDIDPTVKKLNPNWITSPRTQLENTMLRDLAHTRLYRYINSLNMDDAELEKHDAKVLNNQTPTLATASTEQQDTTKPMSVIALATDVQKRMIKALSDGEDNITGLMDELVALIKAKGQSLSDQERYHLEAIYNECRDIIVAAA